MVNISKIVFPAFATVSAPADVLASGDFAASAIFLATQEQKKNQNGTMINPSEYA